MKLSNKMLVEIDLFTFQVGPNYGRKMMNGYVRSKGLTLSGNQVSKSLRRVNPVSHARRRKIPYVEEIRRFRIARPTMETSYTAIKTKGCMDVRFMYLATVAAQELLSFSPCLRRTQSLYLIITYFRASLISRIWKRNISRDLNFAILANHRFSR